MKTLRITTIAVALAAAFGVTSMQVAGARAAGGCEIAQPIGGPAPACQGGAGSNFGGGTFPIAGGGAQSAPQAQPLAITGFNMTPAGSTSIGVVMPAGNVVSSGGAMCMIAQSFPPSNEPPCLGGAGTNAIGIFPVPSACPSGTSASNGACFAPLTFTSNTSTGVNGPIQVTVAPSNSASASVAASGSSSVSSPDPTAHLSAVLGSEFGPWRDYLAAQIGYGPDQLKAMTDYFGSLPACWAAFSSADCTAAIMADVAFYFPAG